MKKASLLLIVVLALFSCGEPTSKVQESEKTDQVEVLYFHGKQRCITCNAIETLTKEVVDELSGEGVVMRVVDISQSENEAIADKYEVTWSSLIITRGDKIENLTDMGFGYAKNEPEVFKSKLKESINQMLK